MSDYQKGSEWRKWDLHIHSSASDGHSTPEEIIAEAKRKELSVIAITDHHTVANIEEAKRLGSASGITVLTGVEFKTEYGATSVHMIGLFPDRYNGVTLTAEAINNLVLAKSGISRTEIIARGRELGGDISDDIAFKKGLMNVVVDFKKVCGLIHEQGGLVVVHNGSKANSLDSEVKHYGKSTHNAHSLYDDLGPLKIELMRNYIDICEVRNANDGVDFYFSEFGKPSIAASDAHETKNIGSKFTWIKADPTFEGLRQIVYEPMERVRIQERSPAFDFDKASLVGIDIREDTPVFVEENDVFLGRAVIPLNSGLVSIIGGRGAGKSILVDYLSTGLGMGGNTNRFTCREANVSVWRNASMLDGAKEFPFHTSPTVKFIYISQGQIKELIKDKQGFSKNIRETIGVLADYAPAQNLLDASEKVVNEYYRIYKTLSPSDSDPKSYKLGLQSEVKKYADYIENITSEANREKLNNYAKLVAQQNTIRAWSDGILTLVKDIESSAALINSRIEEFNQKLQGSRVGTIPAVDMAVTIQFLRGTLLAKISEREAMVEKEMRDIKACFASFTGDPSSLLANVADYQKRQTELEQKLSLIASAEKDYESMKCTEFANLGTLIRESVEEYSNLIEKTWAKFKEGSGELPADRKELLHAILREDNLNVRVEIDLDWNRMYEKIVEPSYIDKRHYTQNFIGKILGIRTLAEFFAFIEQKGPRNMFAPDVDQLLRQRLIDVFFKKFPSFISHRIIVESNGKPLDKLSHGQKGTIYLRLQIAANLFTETIIYDQPEDDLDNRFITSELVEIFRKIKKYRQVIIVSHNANLVVNADSEQVIVAENDGGVLRYASGSLENPTIRTSVCNILEGGREAFARRGLRYAIRQD